MISSGKCRTIDDIFELATEDLEWAGPSGRLAKTIQLMREFIEKANGSREHLYMRKELVDIVDIYTMWKSHIGQFTPSAH